MASKSKVYFFFDNIYVSLPNRKKLKKKIEFLFKNEKKSLVSLNYVFCSDKALLSINRKYLKHDFYTDIITFSLSNDKQYINGEAYISVERVRDNARKLNTSLSKELLRVIFHGALHLCGFNDKTKGQRIRIRKKEDYYISIVY